MMVTGINNSEEKSVSRLSIAGIPPFTEKVQINFHKRINVLIGPNATGKSTVLRALGFSLGPEYSNVDTPPYAVLSGNREWPKLKNDGMPEWDDLPWIYIPPMRKGIPSDGQVLLEYQNIPPKGQSMEINNKKGRDREIPYLLDGERTYKEILSLYRNHDTRAFAVDVIQAAYACVRKIAGEVFLGGSPAHYQGDPDGGADLHRDPNDELRIPLVGIRTVDNTSRPLFLGMLSSGSQGQYLWILHMILEIASWYEFRRDWKMQPAILLIDEIENQLHPIWQRRVIPTLTSHFPRLQVFAATHSPMIVAGLSAGQVHLFRRDSDANNIVKVETLSDRDIKGWTADEILQTLMGLDDPTDEAAAKAKQALDKLHLEGVQNNPFEEQRRQNEIERLREEIAGPTMTQSEMFVEEFAAALTRFQTNQRSMDVEANDARS